MNSYNDDGIIKLKKNEWSSRVKTSKWGSLEWKPKLFWKYSKIPKNRGRHAITEKYPMNRKCQSSPRTENPSKGSTLRIWIQQAKISCPELINPFRFVLTSIKMLCSRFKMSIEFVWNSPKQKSFHSAQWLRTHEQTKKKLSYIPFLIKLWNF